MSCHDTLNPECMWAPGSMQCSEVRLKQLASRPALYVYAGDGVGSYGGAASLIARSAIGLNVEQVVITDTLTPDFALIPGSMSPSGEHDAATGAITWTLPITASVPQTVTFSLRARDVISTAISAGAQASFADSDGHTGAGVIDSPNVTITERFEMRLECRSLMAVLRAHHLLVFAINVASLRQSKSCATVPQARRRLSFSSAMRSTSRIPHCIAIGYRGHEPQDLKPIRL